MSISQSQMPVQQKNMQKMDHKINSLLVQKKMIKKQLRIISSSIQNLKTQQYHYRQSLYNDSEEKAKLKAISFIKKIQRQKKSFQEKKMHMLQKERRSLYKKQQKQQKQRQEQQQRKKGQRIMRLQKKILQQEQMNEIRLKLNKKSNKLIKEITQNQKKLRQMQSIVEQQNNKITKKQRKKKEIVDLKCQMNPQAEQTRQDHKQKQRGNVVNYPMKKYPRTKWNELIEQDKQASKHQLHLKSLQKKSKLQKRIQYGSLISHVFNKQIKNKTKLAESIKYTKQLNDNDNDGDYSNTVNILPGINNKIQEKVQVIQKQSFNKKKKKISSGRKHPILSNYDKKSNQILMSQQKQLSKSNIFTQQMKKKLLKQKKNRLETLKRIQKYDDISFDLLIHQKSKQKYKNYLGTVPIIKKPQQLVLSYILNNESLSKEQKCFQLLKKSTQIQNKVRLKLESKKSDKKSLELFINNIQAKIDLLKII